MKKLLKNAALLSLCAVTFVGCGNSKVDFATFKQKAEEALKTTVEYKTAKITGSAKFGSTTLSIDCDATVKSDRTLTTKSVTDSLYSEMINEFKLNYFCVSEIDGDEYYAGSGFEIKETATNPSNSSEIGTGHYTWNENGLLTYLNAILAEESFEIKVSYSK